MARRRKKIGEILVDWKIITQKALDEALAYALKERKRIGEALVELELCTEEDVTKALATQFDMPYIDLSRSQAVTSNLHLIDDKIMKAHKVLPMGEENGRLKIIIGDPLDLETLDLLRFRLNPNLEVCLAPPTAIKKFQDQFLTGDYKKAMQSSIDSIDQDRPDEETEGITVAGEDPDAPIIKLLNQIIGEAVRMRASDIHIEPMTNRVRVRYRVDGVCAERERRSGAGRTSLGWRPTVGR